MIFWWRGSSTNPETWAARILVPCDSGPGVHGSKREKPWGEVNVNPGAIRSSMLFANKHDGILMEYGILMKKFLVDCATGSLKTMVFNHQNYGIPPVSSKMAGWENPLNKAWMRKWMEMVYTWRIFCCHGYNNMWQLDPCLRKSDIFGEYQESIGSFAPRYPPMWDI